MAVNPKTNLGRIFRPANSLSRRDQAALGELVEPRSWADGELLFRAQEPSNDLHLVVRGCVEVFAEANAGRRVMLGRVRAGEMVGEMGVIDSLPRSASAMSRGPSETLVLTRENYQILASSGDPVALWLLDLTAHNLAERIQSITNRVARVRADATVLHDPPVDPQAQVRRWWRWLGLGRSSP